MYLYIRVRSWLIQCFKLKPWLESANGWLVNTFLHFVQQLQLLCEKKAGVVVPNKQLFWSADESDICSERMFSIGLRPAARPDQHNHWALLWQRDCTDQRASFLVWPSIMRLLQAGYARTAVTLTCMEIQVWVRLSAGSICFRDRRRAVMQELMLVETGNSRQGWSKPSTTQHSRTEERCPCCSFDASFACILPLRAATELQKDSIID